MRGQVFLRGLPEDFERWESFGPSSFWRGNGATCLALAVCCPSYRKSETDMDIQDDFHAGPVRRYGGAEGPLPIVRREKEEWPEVQRAFYQARIMMTGCAPNHDLNGPNSGGQFPYGCGPSR